MTAKVVELKSGTVITKRTENDYDEVWEIECKAVAMTYVTIDMSRCSDWEVDGHEGMESFTEVWEPMECRTLIYTEILKQF